jgi:hypothetical protein
MLIWWCDNPACNCDNGGQTPLTNVSKGDGGLTGCVFDPQAGKRGTFAGAYENTGQGPDGGGWPGAENCSTVSRSSTRPTTQHAAPAELS